jgi:hypothetical protein
VQVLDLAATQRGLGRRVDPGHDRLNHPAGMRDLVGDDREPDNRTGMVILGIDLRRSDMEPPPQLGDDRNHDRSLALQGAVALEEQLETTGADDHAASVRSHVTRLTNTAGRSPLPNPSPAAAGEGLSDPNPSPAAAGEYSDNYGLSDPNPSPVATGEGLRAARHHPLSVLRWKGGTEMAGRAVREVLRLGARIAVALVIYDLMRGVAIGPPGAAVIAQVAGGLLAGAITIIIGKFLYDTFIPVSRTP